MNHFPRLVLAMASSAVSIASLAAQSVTATNTVLGAGCIASYASFYESFATSGAFDLANSSITMIPSAGGYFVLAGSSAYVPPSVTATTLALGDDTEAIVALTAPMPFPGGSTNSLAVCSNGYVSVATGNGTAWTPATPAFLGAAQTGWWNWHDYNPAIVAGGRVKFEQVGAIAYVTWDGVWDFQGTTAANANTFQFQFDTSTGFVHLVFQTMSALGNARLVGYSPGGPNANPGSTDLSVALPLSFTVRGADVLPLTVTALTRPVTGTAWNIDVTNVPAAGVLGVDIIGFTDPGLNDLAFLGLPGCGLRTSLDLLSPWTPIGATHSYSLGIPANPAIVNIHLFTTSAVFVAGVNAFGAITGNGLDGKIGDV